MLMLLLLLPPRYGAVPVPQRRAAAAIRVYASGTASCIRGLEIQACSSRGTATLHQTGGLFPTFCPLRYRYCTRALQSGLTVQPASLGRHLP